MYAKQRSRVKPLVWGLIALLTVLLAVGGWLLFDRYADRSGWGENKSGYYYRDFHGHKVSDWVDIDGSRYYFGDDSVMATGWQDIGGSRYYFGSSGVMRSGWQELDGSRYYFDGGILLTDWLDIEEKRYHFGADGVMSTGWAELEGKTYRFDETGAMVSGWYPEGGHTYFFGETGAMQIGWYLEDGHTYRFDPDGHMLTGRQTVDDAVYLFTPEGYLYTGWDSRAEGRRYYQADGSMAQDWAEIDGLYYCFGQDGLAKTGWQQRGEYRCYFGEDGNPAMGAVDIEEKTHYFTPRGIEIILVNAKNRLPNGYEVNLVTVDNTCKVSDVCADALEQMLADCKAAGNSYHFSYGYRTQSEQSRILEKRIEKYMEDNEEMTYEDARHEALRTVAIPGTSEHQLGLAVDISGSGADAWLSQHCWDYGFIVRYREDKYKYTGIASEPWHFRYVGTEVSLDMRDSGLCLEEYLGAKPVKG